MRVYHFISEKHGLHNLRQQRLKVATINELNDPFELLSPASTNPEVRQAFLAVKQALAQYTGLLCFSGDWRNPVLWSHYADRHRGLCLGFDVTAELVPVLYTRKRLRVDMNKVSDGGQSAEDEILKVLTTKFSHWRYEKEYRMFIHLEERDANGLYFYEFDDKVTLKQVIVGHESTITRRQLKRALGDLAPDVEVLKGRLAFRSFRVVRQRAAALWK